MIEATGYTPFWFGPDSRFGPAILTRFINSSCLRQNQFWQPELYCSVANATKPENPLQGLEAELVEGSIGGRGSEVANGLEVRRIEEAVVAIEGGHYG